MRQAVLLGNPDTKRTVYLRQAAEEIGLPVLFLDWRYLEDQRESLFKTDTYLKIDPPLWSSCSLTGLNPLIREYKSRLKQLSCPAGARHVTYLNSPSHIMALLDKRECKNTLSCAGLPVTELLGKAAGAYHRQQSAEQLLEEMRSRSVYQVFIKPVYGSGAAGVSAFRWHPKSGRMALYTCAQEHPEYGLVNTKRLRQYLDPARICSLLDQILRLDCIVERWHAKAEYQGFSYDLRAVVQEGRLDYLLARLSKGPVTNLHLNNHPLDLEALKLPASVQASVTEVCLDAMKCYPGLKSAGIDILLEKRSLQPRIIEMNAQGDLIYQDIYHENVIYRHQAEMMKRWLQGIEWESIQDER